MVTRHVRSEVDVQSSFMYSPLRFSASRFRPWSSISRFARAVTSMTLTITGTSFGPAGSKHVTDVTVGGVACTGQKVSVAHKEIQCTMPAGTGSNKDVTLKVEGQFSSGGVGKFSYSQPILVTASVMGTDHKVEPSVVHAAKWPQFASVTGPWLVLKGTHFGPLNTNIDYVRVGVDMSTTAEIGRAHV